MLEFRLLGPLEVEREDGVLHLGGQRQRAVLAALLLRPGEVVASERLVDLLWGEQAPRTAKTSLQNAVGQLRKLLGPDVLVTRPPGYVLHVDRGSIDAVRFERQLGEARLLPPERRAVVLREALGLWRGPALAEFAAEEFAQGEIRRLEELRLVALEERIAADIELGRQGDVIVELEALVTAHPLREGLVEQLMRALYAGGRQAEALQAYQDARKRLVDELGIEPSPRLQELQRQILRQEAGVGAATNGRPDLEGEIAKALLADRVVPVLGLAGSAALATHLAAAFDYPPRQPARSRPRLPSTWTTMKGAGPLYDELHARFEAAVASPAPVHRFPRLVATDAARAWSRAPADRDHELRPLGLERAFEEAGEELDVVAYVSSGPHRGRFWHRPPGEAPRPVELAQTPMPSLSFERRTVLLKLRGAVDVLPEREWESFVITEDDHIDYLGRQELASTIPVTLAARLRRSHFLFLGYEMSDWNLRLVLNRVWGDRAVAYSSWAVQPDPSQLERAFWRHFDVEPLDAGLDDVVQLLDARLDGSLAA